ncbi:MAG: hypothetical protein U0974_16125, partial [Gemmatimonadales bacterium]|nr:hypothetical protein [Gemmatimonadales bacterium]
MFRAGGTGRAGRTLSSLEALIPVGRCAARVLVAALLLSPPVAAQVTILAPGGISVTPKGGPALTVSPNSSGNTGFFVSSTCSVATTVQLLCNPTGSVTSCDLDQTELTLDPFETLDIQADFTTGGAGTGRVTVEAVGWDDGWRDVIVSGVAAPMVTQPRQPDSLIDRSHCLTAAAAWAAWSCGDGLFQLSSPAVTTLDRARALTLVHATNTASPRPWVMAEVTPPVGSLQPNHVTVELTVRDTLRRTAVYAGWG